MRFSVLVTFSVSITFHKISTKKRFLFPSLLTFSLACSLMLTAFLTLSVRVWSNARSSLPLPAVKPTSPLTFLPQFAPFEPFAIIPSFIHRFTSFFHFHTLFMIIILFGLPFFALRLLYYYFMSVIFRLSSCNFVFFHLISFTFFVIFSLILPPFALKKLPVITALLF